MNRVNHDNIFERFHPAQQKLLANAHLTEFRHFSFPGFNLHHNDFSVVDEGNVEDAIQFYKPFPLSLDYALPCCTNAIVNTAEFNGNDPVQHLVSEKYKWSKYKGIWTRMGKQMLKKQKYVAEHVREAKVRKTEENQLVTMPRIVAQLADHLKKDPDKYFDGVIYNWYYGNNAAFITLEDKSYLLTANSLPENEMKVSRVKFRKNDNHKLCSPSVQPKFGVSMKEEGPLFDIVASSGTSFVGVRQKHACTFLELRESESQFGVDVMQCYSIKSDQQPFISLDIKDNDFCVASMDRTVQIWSLSHGPPKGKAEVPKIDGMELDTFMCLKCSKDETDPYSIAIADRHRVFLYDRRTDMKSPVGTWNPQDIVETCEEISYLLPSTRSHHWYVCLNHSAFLLDTRRGFVQKWTHMLRQPPSVGCVQKIDSKELVILGTQHSNDTIGICNDWTSDSPRSNYLPMELPNRLNTLYDARFNGTCLDPSLAVRFQDSVTGLISYHRKKHTGFFIASRTGAFHVGIRKLESAKREDDPHDPKNDRKLTSSQIDFLSEWETHCLLERKKAEKSFHVSSVISNDVFHMIREQNPEPPVYDEFNWREAKHNWRCSKKKLQSYTDLLASKILSEYRIDEESEWEPDESEEENKAEQESVSSIRKVSSWLNQNESDMPHDSALVEKDDSSSSGTPENVEDAIDTVSVSASE